MNSAHEKLCSSPEWADHLASAVLRKLVGKADLGLEMLELGPGFGAATEWLRHRVRRLVALEVDPRTAAALAARYAGTNVTVVTGDCADSGFRDRSFDSVGCFTMLHHVPTAPLQRAVLSEAFRLLRPGGVLIGSDSLASSQLRLFHAGDTYNPLDPAWLSQELQALGFIDVTIWVANELAFIGHRATSAEGGTT